MEPEGYSRFGGGAAETAVHPLVALLLLVVVVLIFILPRQKVIIPFLVGMFMIPVGQVVVLGGLHFTGLRILILAGLARMYASRNNPTSEPARFPGGFNPMDQVLAIWAVSSVVTFGLLYMNVPAVINHLGDLIDNLAAYAVVRYLVPDGEAIVRTVKVLAVICVIQSISMISEQYTHINPFGLVGGIGLESTIRDGKVRSSGVMGCIYAGAFAGVLPPIFTWLWTTGKARMLAAIGLVACVIMVITSASSTSYLALGGSVVGLAFWFLRKKMRLVRWGVAGLLVSLHLAMKAPVWFLIARIDLTGSSSGDHRAELIDNCIRHFWSWWLIGTKDYNNWGWSMWDLCNQFVAVAVTSGLFPLVCYILIFKRGFSAIGNARKQIEGDKRQEFLLWALGSTLFATIVASFGINYVPQLLMGFFPLLACISVATFEIRQSMPVPVPSEDEQALPIRGMTGAFARFGSKTRTSTSASTKERVQPWAKV
jgi:uncharacterized integral membrane protein